MLTERYSIKEIQQAINENTGFGYDTQTQQLINRAYIAFPPNLMSIQRIEFMINRYIESEYRTQHGVGPITVEEQNTVIDCVTSDGGDILYSQRDIDYMLDDKLVQQKIQHQFQSKTQLYKGERLPERIFEHPELKNNKDQQPELLDLTQSTQQLTHNIDYQHVRDLTDAQLAEEIRVRFEEQSRRLLEKEQEM